MSNVISELIFFNAETGTGNKTYTLSNFGGETPKAVIIGVTGNTALGQADHSIIGMGMATSSSEQGATSIADEDNSMVSDVKRGGSNNNCIFLHGTGTAIILEADFVSFNANNFILNYVTVGSAHKCWALVLGGDDLTNAKVVNWQKWTATDSSYSRTDVGFQADGALHLISQNDTTEEIGTSFVEGQWFWGSTNQASATFNAADNVMNNNERWRMWSTEAILKQGTSSSASTDEGTFTSWDSTGWTANVTKSGSVASYMHSLYLKGPTIEVAEGTYPTGLGDDNLNVGFKSIAAMVATSGSTSASKTGEDYHSHQVGVTDGTNQASIAVAADFSDSSDTYSYHSETKLIQHMDETGADDGIATINGVASPNVTVNFTTATNADNYWVWAIEDTAGGDVNITVDGVDTLAINQALNQTVTHPVSITTNAPDALAVDQTLNQGVTHDLNITTNAPDALAIDQNLNQGVTHNVNITTNAPQQLDVDQALNQTVEYGINVDVDGIDTLVIDQNLNQTVTHDVDITTNAPDALAVDQALNQTVTHDLDITTNAPDALAIDQNLNQGVTHDLNITTSAPDALAINQGITQTVTHDVAITTNAPDALVIDQTLNQTVELAAGGTEITTNAPQALAVDQTLNQGVAFAGNVDAGVDTLSINQGLNQGVTHDVDITTSAPDALSITQLTQTITYDVDLTTSSPDALTIAGQTQTVTHPVNITTNTDALVIAGLTADITFESSGGRPYAGAAGHHAPDRRTNIKQAEAIAKAFLDLVA